MSFVDVNAHYEKWLRTACHVDEDDLVRKHERMKKSAFVFLRATFFRWAHSITMAAPELLSAPALLCLGDAHLENFGTWRDAEGRLVWGLNDFDDVAVIPYTSDLVRLAVSVRLAAVLTVSNHDASGAILEGYGSGLREPTPTLLDEKEVWMRDYVACSDEDRISFWLEVDSCADIDPPEDAKAALIRHLPAGAEIERFAKRSKGGGSLGRPRFIVVATWRGGRVVREAKASWLPDGTGLTTSSAIATGSRKQRRQSACTGSLPRCRRQLHRSSRRPIRARSSEPPISTENWIAGCFARWGSSSARSMPPPSQQRTRSCTISRGASTVGSVLQRKPRRRSCKPILRNGAVSRRGAFVMPGSLASRGVAGYWAGEIAVTISGVVIPITTSPT